VASWVASERAIMQMWAKVGKSVGSEQVGRGANGQWLQCCSDLAAAWAATWAMSGRVGNNVYTHLASQSVAVAGCKLQLAATSHN